METLKSNMCGGDVELADGQSVAESGSCGNRQNYDAPAAQENAAVSDTDIVNEIESLLNLYKLAIDGGIWTNYDGIFDDVQDIEYELAPESEFPVVTEEDEPPVAASEEETENPLTNDVKATPDAKHVLAEAIAYIKQNKKLAFIAAGAACAMIVLLMVLSSAIAPKAKDTDAQLNSTVYPESTENPETIQATNFDNTYNNAIALMDSGKYDEAIAIFEALDGYEDSAEMISEYHYREASSLLEINATLHALNRFSKAGNYKDAPAQAAALRKLYLKALQLQTISAGENHTVALKADGTVVAAGINDLYQCDVSGWTDIVSISVGDNHTAGLKADGRVLNTGAINYGQGNVSQWWDITAISAARYHTVGLTAEGTVRAAGRSDYGQCDVWSWTEIAAISTGDYHTVGLKTDGTVVATGNNSSGQCDVSGWTDIVAIYAGDNHTVGMKADGTAVATGYNAFGQCDISDWTNLIDIGIGNSFTVALKADGTVITAGYDYGDLKNVSGWTDIVDISVSTSHVAGLKADGTIVTVNFDDPSTISGWTGIKLPG